MNDLFAVSMAMYHDILEFLCGEVRSGAATIHISDYDALCQLTAASAATIREAPFYRQLPPVTPWIKHLGMSLRLPFNIAVHCQPVLHADVQHETPPVDPSTSPHFSQWKLWSWLEDIIPDILSLQTLSVWLDHDDPRSWAYLDEHILLVPLVIICEKTTVAVSVDLPEVEPSLATRGYNYMGAPELIPPFTITRRVRERPFVDSTSFYPEFLGLREFG
jgi:hypothetical protein